jgi:hypothetical protein
MTLRSVTWALGAAAVAALVACGSGSGGPIVTTTGTGSELPAPTWEPPPATRDGTGAACIVCDVSYVCSGGGTIEISSASGYCTQAVIDLVCSGEPFGTGPCVAEGEGEFSCGSITCVPEQNGFGSNGSSGGIAIDGG